MIPGKIRKSASSVPSHSSQPSCNEKHKAPWQGWGWVGFQKDGFSCYGKGVSSFTLIGPPLTQSLYEGFMLIQIL